jgi:hypothetical protein
MDTPSLPIRACRWLLATVWSARDHPDQYVVHKMVVDLALFLVWLPMMLLRTSAVYSSLCFPLWDDAACQHYISQAYRPPVILFLAALCFLIICYAIFYSRLRSALGALTHNVKNAAPSMFYTRHIVYSYFAIFLLMHIYFSFVWITYIVSMNLVAMVVLVAIGILQDLYILSKYVISIFLHLSHSFFFFLAHVSLNKPFFLSLSLCASVCYGYAQTN